MLVTLGDRVPSEHSLENKNEKKKETSGRVSHFAVCCQYRQELDTNPKCSQWRTNLRRRRKQAKVETVIQQQDRGEAKENVFYVFSASSSN